MWNAATVQDCCGCLQWHLVLNVPHQVFWVVVCPLLCGCYGVIGHCCSGLPVLMLVSSGQKCTLKSVIFWSNMTWVPYIFYIQSLFLSTAVLRIQSASISSCNPRLIWWCWHQGSVGVIPCVYQGHKFFFKTFVK